MPYDGPPLGADGHDWRYSEDGEYNYLRGLVMTRKAYARQSEAWDHEHGEFCWQTFAEYDGADTGREGYSDEAEDYWVCSRCYKDFKDALGWRESAVT